MSKGPPFLDGNAKRHRARVEQRKRMVARYNGTGEPQVVPGYQLAAVLQEWRKRYVKERPPNYRTGQIAEAGKIDDFVSPVQFLIQETGLPDRRIRGYINGEYPVVGHTRAELLLMAIDREYMLVNGEIQTVPNPHWSLEKYLEWRREQGCV